MLNIFVCASMCTLPSTEYPLQLNQLSNSKVMPSNMAEHLLRLPHYSQLLILDWFTVLWYTKPAVTSHAERIPTTDVNLSNHTKHTPKPTETFKIRSKDTANDAGDKSAEITFIPFEILETSAFHRLMRYVINSDVWTKARMLNTFEVVSALLMYT